MNPSRAPIDIAVAVTIVLILPALSAWSGAKLRRTTDAERRLAGRYVWIIVRSLLLVALIVGVWQRLGRPFAALGLDSPIGRLGRLGFVIDAAITLYFVYSVVLRKRSQAELTIVRDRLRRMQSDRMLPQTPTEERLFPWVAITGSIAEELLYRGFLIWFFAPTIGVVGAILISSVAFGIGHVYLGWTGVVRTAVIGVAFASAFVMTGSLWWLMIAHITANLSGLPLQRRLQPDPRSPLQGELPSY